MNGRGLNYGDMAGHGATQSAFPWFGGLLTFVVVGLVIAATVMVILLLIDAARNRGVEVKGGRLVAFWFVGICLTPIMLALYVLTLNPTPKHAAPSIAGAYSADHFSEVVSSEPMSSFEDATYSTQTTQVIEPPQATVKQTDV